MTNLDMYNSLSEPPEWALKQIQGGRMSGKTDINPQWRIKALTEKFGPCGVGWKYKIEKLWTEKVDGSPEIGAFALITLQYKTNSQGGWSEEIPGVGGNMLLQNEKKGLHFNDDAFKMCVTDAISVAAKAIGVAGKIYEGLADDSKYGNERYQNRGNYQQQNNYSQQPTQPYNYNQTTNPGTTQQLPQQRALTPDEIEGKWNGKIYKNNTVYIDNVKITITPMQAQELTMHPKFNPGK